MTEFQKTTGIFIVYFILVAIITWPSIWDIDKVNHFYCNAFMDKYVDFWNFNNVKESLINGKSPFSTDRLFYPKEKSLGLFTPTYFYALCSTPIQLLIPGEKGLYISYNLFIITSFLFSAFGLYLLSRKLGLSYYAAFLAGIIFSFSSFQMANLSRLTILSVEFIPFYFLGLLLSFEKKGFLAPFGTAITVVLLFYNSLTHAFGLGLMTIILIPLLLKWRSPDWHKRTALIAISIIILCAPLFYSVIKALIECNACWSRKVIANLSIGLFTLFWPNKYDYLWSFVPFLRPVNPLEPGFSFFLGFPLILLLCIAAVRSRDFPPSKILWSMVFFFFVIMLGPNLKVMERIKDISLPYLYLSEIFPPFKITRVPARLLPFFFLPISLLAGFGAEVIFNRVGRIRILRIINYRLNLIFLVSVFLAGFLILESVETLPLRKINRLQFKSPDLYCKLHSDPIDFAILDLPFDSYLTRRLGMFYQTSHNKGILYAQYPRAKSNNIKKFEKSDLFQLLISKPIPQTELEKRLSIIDFQKERKLLRDLGIGMIVFHETLIYEYKKGSIDKNTMNLKEMSVFLKKFKKKRKIDIEIKQLRALKNSLSKAWGDGDLLDFGPYRAMAFRL